MRAQTFLIGGLGPLSRPGIPWAGRELFDAMHLAVREVNRARDAGHSSLQLLWENTSGSPATAVEDVQASMDRPGPHMLLLLRSYPEDLKSFLARLGIGNPPSSSIAFGDPPGRPIFRDWWEIAGAVEVPFLAYAHPRRLTDCG